MLIGQPAVVIITRLLNRSVESRCFCNAVISGSVYSLQDYFEDILEIQAWFSFSLFFLFFGSRCFNFCFSLFGLFPLKLLQLLFGQGY